MTVWADRVHDPILAPTDHHSAFVPALVTAALTLTGVAAALRAM